MIIVAKSLANCSKALEQLPQMRGHLLALILIEEHEGDFVH